MRKLYVSLIVIVFMISCISYSPRTLSSGSSLQLGNESDDYEKLGISEGTACSSYVFGIRTEGEFTYHAAVRNAISKLDGDLLIQTTTDISTGKFFPIAYKRCILVEGLVIRLKDLKVRRKNQPKGGKRGLRGEFEPDYKNF